MLELSNRPERLERVAQKIDDGTDWFLFLKLVEFHRVYPSIRHILQSVNRTIVPKQVSEEIHRLCVSNTLQMLYLTAELDRVNELFENNRVRALSLKGLHWRSCSMGTSLFEIPKTWISWFLWRTLKKRSLSCFNRVT
nr:nucleotidyltransferase family protein [Cohnella algarum]